MSKELKYLIFAIEEYKTAYGLSGREVYDIFRKYDFFSYIIDLYELLHIEGTQHLLENLAEYQKTRKNTAFLL